MNIVDVKDLNLYGGPIRSSYDHYPIPPSQIFNLTISNQKNVEDIGVEPMTLPM